MHPTGNKGQHSPRHKAELDCSKHWEPTSCPGELPQRRQREEDPLAEHLRGCLQRSFPQGLGPSPTYKVDVF